MSWSTLFLFHEYAALQIIIIIIITQIFEQKKKSLPVLLFF